MANISTAATNIILFDFRGRSVRAISIEGEPWFVAVDVCRVLGQSNTTKALYALDEDERSNFKLGRQGSVNIINESGLYTLILRCDDAIKKGSDAHAFRKWVTAEVLPAIRKHGHYSDDSGKMGTLVNDVIGMSGATLIGGVISQKVSVLPTGVQRQARHKLHAILHTRFNVPRTELIPADKLDTACQYIGAYVLEGEWLEKPKGIQIEPGRFRRYLVSFNHNGEQQITPVPADACVMTVEQMIKAMLTPGDLPVSTDEMFEFVQAGLMNLKMRSDCQTHQLRASRAAA
ncbi:BRO-N domain-containing protein [Stutzerimonas nitrititolerans]|uniref:BRO-N domain-containing protein n=1 Tax=Stutzerimonas nitrititolerans TaxID=2482751 RepID=UPI0028B1C438|nr:BRO family protein [Stutzerimonas nitrititolerans]